MIMISAHSNAISNRYQIFHKRKAVSEGSEKDQERYILTRSLIDYFVYVVCGVTIIMFRQFFCLPQLYQTMTIETGTRFELIVGRRLRLNNTRRNVAALLS